MGYNRDLLKAEFKGDRINKQKETSVTVPNTLARHQALAKAKTHGKNFFVTGGEHCALQATCSKQLKSVIESVIFRQCRGTRLSALSTPADSKKHSPS